MGLLSPHSVKSCPLSLLASKRTEEPRLQIAILHDEERARTPINVYSMNDGIFRREILTSHDTNLNKRPDLIYYSRCQSEAL